MRTLMLLRHAKAEPRSPQGDFGRALNERGREEAKRLGIYLAGRSYAPDLTLVSSARRTRETIDILNEMTHWSSPRFENGLYDATGGQLRDILALVSADVGTLLIVGHNPGIADVAVMLSRDGDIVEREKLRSRFPPCALAVVSFACDDWRDARVMGGSLDLFVLPESLTGRA